MFTSKLIGGWINWPDMQMLFKFQVNWIIIEDFRNLASVDLLVYVDLFAYDNHKNNRWLNSVTWYVNPFQISAQSDEIEDLENFAQIGLLSYFDFLAFVYIKINRSLNSATWYANALQISSPSDGNWDF